MSKGPGPRSRAPCPWEVIAIFKRERTCSRARTLRIAARVVVRKEDPHDRVREQAPVYIRTHAVFYFFRGEAAVLVRTK